MIISRLCTLFSSPVNFVKKGKKSHLCWTATCGHTGLLTTTPSPPTTTVTTITKSTTILDCGVSVRCLRDIDSDFTSTNGFAPDLGSFDAAVKAGSYKHPMLYGVTKNQCYAYVRMLNKLGKIKKKNRKVKCTPWQSDNTIETNNPDVPLSYPSIDGEASPAVGWALMVNGPRGDRGNTVRCDKTAAALNAALGFTSTTFAGSTQGEPFVGLICEPMFCNEVQGNCIVRLTSPITKHDVALSEFSCNSAWRQINHALFDIHCDDTTQMCSEKEQTKFGERSCNDPQGVTQEDCEVPIFYRGLGPRPSTEAIFPSSGDTFAPRGDVGQSGFTFGSVETEVASIFDWEDDALYYREDDNIDVLLAKGYEDCVNEPGCLTPGQALRPNLAGVGLEDTDPVVPTTCEPNPLNGLDFWDEECFGPLRVGFTETGYPDNTCKCSAAGCQAAILNNTDNCVSTFNPLSTPICIGNDKSVPDKEKHRLQPVSTSPNVFASTAAERDAQTIAPDSSTNAQSYDQLCFYVRCAFFDRKLHSRNAIGSHACWLEANMRVTNGIPLRSSLLLPVCAVNCVQTRKAQEHPITTCEAPALQSTGVRTLCACLESNVLVRSGLITLCEDANVATNLFDDSPRRPTDGVCNSV
jgi:hypothetical protein